MSLTGMLFGALCTGAGAWCLRLSVREGRLMSRLRRSGLRTEGTVTQRERKRSGDDWTWASVIEFTDGQGRHTEFTSHGLDLAVGSRVPLLYSPEDPKVARVLTKHHRANQALLFLMGLMWLGGAVMIVIAA
ncbi:DUF3592 domain-containing protein [Actinoallomurus sp. CA-150999]|uniref:DUF3592 domain-containing protein n=1 Tax=Actinoallomurus sp. CA-150999 TaxID=3239887 RepID=UPI003D937E8F